MTTTTRLSVRLAAAGAALLLTSATLDAQGPPRLIGWTDAVSEVAAIDPATCGVSSCAAGLAPAVAPFCGGTAYDARDRGLWISNGIDLVKVDPRNGCAPVCPTGTAPGASMVGPFVTGMALDETREILWIAYSNNTISGYDAPGGCALTLRNSCTLSLPNNHVLDGMACIDGGGELFLSSSPWLGPSPSPAALVWTVAGTAPCTPQCSTTVPICGAGSPPAPRLTGLAWDGCSETLWVTTGQRIAALTGMLTCSPTAGGCCTLSTGGTYRGLCWLPSTEQSCGSSCSSGACGACPGLRHVLGSGDPVLGHAGFTLDVLNAPPGALTIGLITGAPCTATGPSFGLCGPLLVPGATLLGTTTTSSAGGGACSGRARVALPIPDLPALCGLTVSTQFVGSCGAAGSSYVTNALTWSITSS